MLINVAKALSMMEKHMEALLSKMLRDEFPEIVSMIGEITVKHGFDVFVSLSREDTQTEERILYRFFREWVCRDDTRELLFELHLVQPGEKLGGRSPQFDALLEESLEKYKDIWERLAQL